MPRMHMHDALREHAFAFFQIAQGSIIMPHFPGEDMVSKSKIFAI